MLYFTNGVFGPWKIGRKKNLESNFFFIVWFEESQKEKNKEKKIQRKFKLL